MSTQSVVAVSTLRGQAGRTTAVALEPADVTIRLARASEADAIHRLVSDHVADGHLLPRSREDITSRLHRFLVAGSGDGIVACADLAPLSKRVAEVRSLVVAGGARACGIGRSMVEELERRARAAGFETLCAFTHAPGYFVQMGFSIVPHVWLPEKIEADCRSCTQFRRCGQYAVMLPLVAKRSTRLSMDAHA